MRFALLLALLLMTAPLAVAQSAPPAAFAWAHAPLAGSPLAPARGPGDVTIGRGLSTAAIGAAAGGGLLLLGLPLALVDGFDDYALVAYPVGAVFGAQLAAGLLSLDGAQAGFVLGGVVGAVPGVLLYRDAETDGDRALGALVFLAGVPVGAVTGGVLVPQMLRGPRGPVAGVALRVGL